VTDDRLRHGVSPRQAGGLAAMLASRRECGWNILLQGV